MVEVASLNDFLWHTEAVPIEVVNTDDSRIPHEISEQTHLCEYALFTDVRRHFHNLTPAEQRVFPLSFRENVDPISAYVPRLHRRVYRLGDYPLLFRTFAELPQTEEGFLSFASRYGFLGGSRSSFQTLTAHGNLGELDPSTAEVTELWRMLVRKFKAIVTLWDATRALDAESLAELLQWSDGSLWLKSHLQFDLFRDDDPDVPDTELRSHGVDSGDTLGGARLLLRRLLSSLTERWARFSIAVSGSDEERPRLVLSPVDLLSAMCFQMAAAITENKDFRQCLQCEKWFEASPSTLQANKQFCSASCRMKAYRERQKEAVQLHAQGESVEALAERFESDPATIRNWICKASRRRGRKPAGEGDEQ